MLNLNLMDSRAGQEIYQMGKNEGLLEGRQEGEQKGRQEGEQKLVMRLLEKRFGKLPTSVKNRLENASPAELDRWSVQLLNANSLEDIFKG